MLTLNISRCDAVVYRALSAARCPFVSMPNNPSVACRVLVRYLDNMTSERVDAGGVSNIAQLLQSLPPANTQA